jgi:hypothetical protein
VITDDKQRLARIVHLDGEPNYKYAGGCWKVFDISVTIFLPITSKIKSMPEDACINIGAWENV